VNDDLRYRVQGARARQQASAGNGSQAPGTDVEKRALSDVHTLLEAMKPEIAKALPRHLTPDRLARIVYTEARKEPKLGYCSAASLAGAVLTCAQLGLEPGPTQEAYIIPRKNRRTGELEAGFQLGYKGMAALFWRHPSAMYLDMQTVYERDEFDWEYGLDPYLKHKPAQGPRGSRKGYWYAVAKLTSGGFRFCVLDREGVEEHRRRSDAPDSPAWRNDYDSMAGKSCLRQMFNLMPKSSEVARALQMDGSVRTDLDTSILDTDAGHDDAIDGEVISDSQPDEVPAGAPDAPGGHGE
jgi:recombination protein RecT